MRYSRAIKNSSPLLSRAHLLLYQPLQHDSGCRRCTFVHAIPAITPILLLPIIAADMAICRRYGQACHAAPRGRYHAATYILRRAICRATEEEYFGISLQLPRPILRASASSTGITRNTAKPLIFRDTLTYDIDISLHSRLSFTGRY